MFIFTGAWFLSRAAGLSQAHAFLFILIQNYSLWWYSNPMPVGNESCSLSTRPRRRLVTGPAKKPSLHVAVAGSQLFAKGRYYLDRYDQLSDSYPDDVLFVPSR